MGKFLIITGIIVLLIGLAVEFLGKIPFLGKLPGDIRIERENFTFYFPLASGLLISVLLTLLLLLVQRWKQ
jgi:hypothetical protein